MALTTSSGTSAQGLRQRFDLSLLHVRQRLRARRIRRDTYEELARLSNRELAILGIHRSQIATIAREAAAQV